FFDARRASGRTFHNHKLPIATGLRQTATVFPKISSLRPGCSAESIAAIYRTAQCGTSSTRPMTVGNSRDDKRFETASKCANLPTGEVFNELADVIGAP